MATRFGLATVFCISIIAGLARSDNNATILLTRCCRENEYYSMGFDHCVQRTEMTQLKFPSIYDAKLEISARPVDFLLTNDNLTSCQSADGRVVKTSTTFRIFENGSMRTSDGIERPNGEFCVDRIPYDDAPFVVRYCIADPCDANKCVRKCCPTGMSLNMVDKICQPGEPLVVPFNNAVESRPSVLIRDGVQPNCPIGMYLLGKDEFYILPDGRLQLSDNQTEVDYCVDNFISHNNTTTSEFIGALLCFPQQSVVNDDLFLSIYPYFLFVSSFFLVATFVVYALLPKLRNTHGSTVMCHAASMSVMYVGLGVIQLIGSNLRADICIGLAVLVHFAFLATFTWLNVLSFDIWWTFKNVTSGFYSDRRRGARENVGRQFVFYSLYAWTVPLLFVGFGQLFENVESIDYVVRPGFGVSTCWFHSRTSYLTYLYGPMSVLILANVVFFLMTAVILCRSQQIDSRQRMNYATIYYSKQKLRAIFILFVLMGLTWMMEVVSFAVGGPTYFWIPTDILNILMGVFVFLIFVCRASVWALLVEKYSSLLRFDRFCPTCIRYGNGTGAGHHKRGADHDEDDDESHLHHTTI